MKFNATRKEKLQEHIEDRFSWKVSQAFDLNHWAISSKAKVIRIISKSLIIKFLQENRNMIEDYYNSGD